MTLLFMHDLQPKFARVYVCMYSMWEDDSRNLYFCLLLLLLLLLVSIFLFQGMKTSQAIQATCLIDRLTDREKGKRNLEKGGGGAVSRLVEKWRNKTFKKAQRLVIHYKHKLSRLLIQTTWTLRAC